MITTPDINLESAEQPTLVYYDGWCTICTRSAAFFTKLDRDRRVVVCVDLRSDDPRIELAGVDVDQLATSLHTRTPDGVVYAGPEAIRVAMEALGKSRSTAWTRWPMIKPIVDRAYLLFARNRLRWFKKQDCTSGACTIDHRKR